ncbi:MAG: hypothetical protein JXA28_04405 [Bacteroidetes bacterium]|nr:hypothetical protein [Bacteroidota bacterium]
MKFLPLLIALLLLPSPAFSQIGWFQQHEGGEDILFAIDLLDENVVTAVGENGLILHSTDGGSNWREIPSGTTQVLRRIRWHSPSLGVILGNSGTALKSTDAGQSWTSLNTGTSKTLLDIHFFDNRTWILIGQAAQVLNTTDGGATFSDDGSGTNNYNEIAIYGDFGVLVGNKGTIRVTRDGGKKWRSSTSPIDLELTSVSIGDDSTAVIVGVNGSILRSSNRGEEWEEIYTSVPISNYRLSAVQHLTRDHVVFAGYGGLVFESSDAGVTWIPQESNTHLNIEGMAFTNSRIGNTAGWNRSIMRTKTGGTLSVTRTADPQPTALQISTAWPNPLSRSMHRVANVSLQLPASGQVTLRVHDLLGRHRTTILSRMMDAGSYTIDWSAQGLEKGVYLCRLSFLGKTRVSKFTVVD